MVDFSLILIQVLVDGKHNLKEILSFFPHTGRNGSFTSVNKFFKSGFIASDLLFFPMWKF